jgi:hypothetical protein
MDERCTRCEAAVVPGSALCRKCVGRSKRYRVTGDTYPHRESLKALGAGWEPSIRTWILAEPDDKRIAKVKKLGLGLEEL